MTLKKILLLSFFSVIFYSCNKGLDREFEKTSIINSHKEASGYEEKLLKVALIDKSFSDYSDNAFKVYSDYVNLLGSNPDKIEIDRIGDFSIIDDNHVNSLNRLDTAVGVPFLSELNPLIRSYKVNARAFAVTINSSKSYYTKKEYKNDQYNQAIVLHKLTLDIYSKFRKADSILRVNSQKASQKLEKEYLNYLKEAGLEAQYLVMIGKKSAESLNEILSGTTYNDIKVERLLSLNIQMNTIYNRLKELKRSDLKQFNPESIIYYSKFEHLHNSVNDLIQHKQENKKFSKDERKKLKENKKAANSVRGSIQAVTYSYRNLLLSFNEIKPELTYTNPKIAETKTAIASSIKIANAIK